MDDRWHECVLIGRQQWWRLNRAAATFIQLRYQRFVSVLEWCPKQEVDLNNKMLTLPPCGALIMKVIRLLACNQRQELKSGNMERHGEEKWMPLEVLKRLSRD